MVLKHRGIIFFNQIFKIKMSFLIFSSQNTITSNHGELPPSRLTGATPGGGWVESINSPLIQEDGDNKMLKLRFDVSQYEPEEIVVKTVDNKLLVSLNRFFDWIKCTFFRYQKIELIRVIHNEIKETLYRVPRIRTARKGLIPEPVPGFNIVWRFSSIINHGGLAINRIILLSAWRAYGVWDEVVRAGNEFYSEWR